jgi:two-component system, LytTR family, response regulator
MIPLQCVLIDDEPLALEVLKQYISRFPELQLVESFSDVVAGEAFLKANLVDLLFIDINMPDKKGTDLVRSLAESPMVIFTTAYKSYAAEGFDLDAVDYLVKPISFERFAKAVQKALQLAQLKKTTQPHNGDSLFVRSEYQLVKIAFSDILYIESMEDYLKIYTANSRPLMTLMTMKAVLDKLPPAGFARIHRSYIVSLAKVRSIINRKITLVNDTELPVSNSYVDVVKSWRK